MRLKEIAISINPETIRPLYLQIADGLAKAMREGRIQFGCALPGTRTLADHLGVSRSTVIAALEALVAQGLVEVRAGSGHFAVPSMDGQTMRGGSLGNGSLEPVFDLPTRQDLVTDQANRITRLSEPLPDSRLMPVDALGRAYHRALRRRQHSLLEYGDPRGDLELRKALSAFLGERRGIQATPDGILLTRGTRMTLNLISQGLLKPDDWVAVENPGNPAAWQCFRSARARLVPIPVDAEGLNVDVLEEILRSSRIRMLYLSPRYQIPTTVGLSPQRRKRLLRLAQVHRFAILEEDSEGDYTYKDVPHFPWLRERVQERSFIFVLCRA